MVWSAQRLNARALAKALEGIAGMTFRDPERLRRALTHPSARAKDAGVDYERMEFLGDRVLALVVTDFLFHTFPEATEGELSLRLNAMVNSETLATISQELGLPDLVNASNELKRIDGVNLRADAMESLIGAIYLDGGLEAARNFIARHWFQRPIAHSRARRDPKTALQEWSHVVGGGVPCYTVERREGPDHDPRFTVSVHLQGFEPATGVGRSKRLSEQAAATAMLVREGVWKEADN